MAKKLKIWYDKEGDYLEVLFSDSPGYMRETENSHILERVDENDKVIGYSILGFSQISDKKPLFTEFDFA